MSFSEDTVETIDKTSVQLNEALIGILNTYPKVHTIVFRARNTPLGTPINGGYSPEEYLLIHNGQYIELGSQPELKFHELLAKCLETHTVANVSTTSNGSFREYRYLLLYSHKSFW